MSNGTGSDQQRSGTGTEVLDRAADVDEAADQVRLAYAALVAAEAAAEAAYEAAAEPVRRPELLGGAVWSRTLDRAAAARTEAVKRPAQRFADSIEVLRLARELAGEEHALENARTCEDESVIVRRWAAPGLWDWRDARCFDSAAELLTWLRGGE